MKKKITDLNHDKCITTPKFNRLTFKNLIGTLKQANLTSKSNVANFVSKTDFNNKLKNVTSNKNE